MNNSFGKEPSAHRDLFARQGLPAQNMWPQLLNGDDPFLQYPTRLNCASELLDKMVAEGHGNSPAIHHSQGTWSYAKLLTTANRIAHVLVDECGLVPGNRVLLRAPNSPLLAAAWFAVLKAGGICVTTMPLLRHAELSHILEKAKIKLAICDAGLTEELFLCARNQVTLEKILCYHGETPANPNNKSNTILWLEELIEKKSGDFKNIDTAAEDIALIAFTSGTTGKAKGTMHFHRDVLTICDIFPRKILAPSASDVFCGTPHFAFTFGLGGLLLFPLRFGASTILLEKSSPEEVLASIAKYKASICFSSPTGYRAMSQSFSKFNLSSLKNCVSAGEVLPKSTFDLWQQLTGIKLIDGIGSTEMLHIFISAQGKDIRPGSTGKPIPPYQAQIVDTSGQVLAPGTVGLLAVRGPTGCRYLSDEDRQREYSRNGWNVTGDTYHMDNDGYFWFHARADDMIISSGYNISGHEVENVLLSHPKVKECAVIGVPDSERGNLVKAVIVLHCPTEACDVLVKELQDFVKGEIAPYKYPRLIEFAERLPRTETGKLQRFKLRS